MIFVLIKVGSILSHDISVLITQYCRCDSDTACHLVVRLGTTVNIFQPDHDLGMMLAYSVSSPQAGVEIAMECVGGPGTHCVHSAGCLPVCGPDSGQCVQDMCVC